jgi:hypothetical protein
MKKRNLLTLGDEFLEYCAINNIDDIDKLAKNTFQRGFTILKYGETPSNTNVKEIIKEVIKEVQVEIIKEVIKEVPIEIIKEIPVEIKGDVQIITNEVIKEIKVIDNIEIERLQIENESLKNELKNITENLEKMGRTKYLKNSDLGNLYDE